MHLTKSIESSITQTSTTIVSTLISEYLFQSKPNFSFFVLLIHFFLLACLWRKSARSNHLLMWGGPNFGACNLSHMLGLITNGSMGGTPQFFHRRVVLIVWWGLLIIHGWLGLHNFIRWLGLKTWWALNLGSAWWLVMGPLDWHLTLLDCGGLLLP